ncbi:hypothetical protein LJR039_007148 [Pseudorhodoferax sp. LjRoot39]|uniref:hypothetical protein n=1 Tax=Pseudorhodoferax sp. LjRoot39 TaxID=3342328 RepID=UPI003ECD1453
MPALRQIAVHVEEPHSGKFTWVLTERAGEDWQPLSRAQSPVRSYKLAMAEGLLALQDLVQDLDLGPRARQEKADTPSASAAPRPASTTPAKGAYFGFGPAR